MSAGEATSALEVVAGAEEVARRAADLFVRGADRATREGHPFRVALSGGSTPRAFHRLLAAPPDRGAVRWDSVQVFWGDERYVPPDDPESNYGMARETLLDAVPIAPAWIFPVPTTLGDPAATAAAYERTIRQAFALAEEGQPRFDLIYLGMGPDGHTASLFPHTAALRAHGRIVVANAVPRLGSYRITLTAQAINAAAEVAFLVSGADKAAALAAVREGPHDPEEYPAQLIAPVDGHLLWVVDRAAAARLKACAEGADEA